MVESAPGVDVVLGPTTGGVILAYECARQLGVRGIFAEEVVDGIGGTHRELRRGFAIAPGERVLLVDDVITTGGSLLAMLPVVEEAAADLVSVSVLVDRSGGLREVESPRTGRRYPVRRAVDADPADIRVRAEHVSRLRSGPATGRAGLIGHEGRRSALGPVGASAHLATWSSAARSSSGPAMPSNLAVTLPSASTTKA